MKNIHPHLVLRIGTTIAFLSAIASLHSAIIRYDASLGSLPTDQGFRLDQATIGGGWQQPIVAGDVLQQLPTTGPTYQYWYYTNSPLNFVAAAYALEWRLHIIDSNYVPDGGGDLGYPRCGYYVEIIDGAGRTISVGISNDRTLINTDAANSLANAVVLTPFDSRDGFHTYRLVIACGTGTLFIDGISRASMPVGGAVNPGVPNRLLFGDGSWWGISDTELQYLSLDVAPACLTCDAGPDFSANEGDPVQLNGCPTTPDTSTFQWSQISGPSVTLSDATLCNPTFIAPAVVNGGQTLTFKLSTTKNGQTCDDTVNVTVVNVNHAPVANAGVDQTVAELAPVTLHGENSFDCDSDAFDFAWVQVSGLPVTLGGANTANPTFTAPVINSGGDPGVVATLVFQLTVDDHFPGPAACSGFGLANVLDTIEIKVSNVDNPPDADAGQDQTVNENASVTLHGESSSDPDGDTLSYVWTQTVGPSVVLVNASSANPSFSAPSVGPGGVEIEFALTVGDGFGGTDTDRVAIHVQNVNDPPLCSVARPSLAELWPPNHKLVAISITGISDPDSDPVSITITGVTQDEPVNGLGDGDTSPDAVIEGSTALLRAERSGTGNGRVYRISFLAVDGQGGSCSGSVSVCVPHDQRPGQTCVDDGQIYNSTPQRGLIHPGYSQDESHLLSKPPVWKRWTPGNP